MLTKRYLMGVKNLDAILAKIVEGAAPSKFTAEHLKSLGFASSNDRTIIPILKDLQFLSADGTPLPRYHAYRDRSRSRAVMAEALREAYEDVFHISETPGPEHRKAIEGLFKSKHNSSDRVSQLQASTFFAFLANADLSAPAGPKVPPGPTPDSDSASTPEPTATPTGAATSNLPLGTLTTELHYTIQVHLPATKDIEVFNAIFRSLRENLLA